MKKIRLTENDLIKIVKRVINEQDSNYVVKECESLILEKLGGYLTKAVNDAKVELSKQGGKFPQSNPPTDEDWTNASINVNRRLSSQDGEMKEQGKGKRKLKY